MDSSNTSYSYSPVANAIFLRVQRVGSLACHSFRPFSVEHDGGATSGVSMPRFKESWQTVPATSATGTMIEKSDSISALFCAECEPFFMGFVLVPPLLELVYRWSGVLTCIHPWVSASSCAGWTCRRRCLQQRSGCVGAAQMSLLAAARWLQRRSADVAACRSTAAAKTQRRCRCLSQHGGCKDAA